MGTYLSLKQLQTGCWEAEGPKLVPNWPQSTWKQHI